VIDSACGYAALTLMPSTAAVLSVEFKVNLLAPARGARFHTHGRVERAGRTLTVCIGELREIESDTVVAIMQATMMAVEQRDDRRD
jgi:acyl-coenzyme A thioesterase PaaI-like protein